MKIEIKDVEYEVKYCGLCKTIILVCPKCDFASCTGGGCDSCHYAYENADKYLKAASIPGELFFKMELDFHKQANEIFKERHGLYKQIRNTGKKINRFRRNKENAMICEDCGEREAEFDAPGKWCEVCWAKWWYEDMNPKDEEEREGLVTEAARGFKNVIEITKLPKEEQMAAAKELAREIVCPVRP